MIDTKYLSDYFTGVFNEFGVNYGKHFKIFADEGELKKATKNYGEAPTDYTSGIVEVMSSSLIPIRDIRLNTYSIQITLFVDLALNGFTSEKESINLNDIRKIITEIIDAKNGTTGFYKNFSQSITFDYPTNGQKSDVGFISDCLPIYLTCNMAFFENGINANNCQIILNGENISFTRAVFTRKRTADSQTFNGDASQKTIMQANGLSIDLVLPIQDNDISRLFTKDCLEGGNFAINVEIITPLYEKTFIGTFGDDQIALDIATNAGGNMSIVEAKENILDYSYSPKWQVVEKHDENVEVVAQKDAVIYWGDGNKLKVLEDGTITHTYTDGKTKHILRIFGG